jgi:hypothetical protein
VSSRSISSTIVATRHGIGMLCPGPDDVTHSGECDPRWSCVLRIWRSRLAPPQDPPSPRGSPSMADVVRSAPMSPQWCQTSCATRRATANAGSEGLDGAPCAAASKSATARVRLHSAATGGSSS